MINSRDPKDLHPIVQNKLANALTLWKAAGIDVLITSTFRDHSSQNALYAQGRRGVKGERKVTNAKGGQSYHNWRVAFDVVPLRNGKPVWGTSGEDGELWQKLGKIGKSVGLEWAGDWERFKEYPHFQYTQGLHWRDFQAGKKLDENK